MFNIDTVRSWYNGYKLGFDSVYNPQSIIQYVEKGKFDLYWVNSGSNEILIKML